MKVLLGAVVVVDSVDYSGRNFQLEIKVSSETLLPKFISVGVFVLKLSRLGNSQAEFY